MEREMPGGQSIFAFSRTITGAFFTQNKHGEDVFKFFKKTMRNTDDDKINEHCVKYEKL